MTKEAELHAEEDEKRKEAVETRNQLDSTVYQMEKMLGEAGDKLPDDKKAPIEGAIAEGKKALESDDAEQMKAAMENLSKLGADLYQAAAAEGAGAPGSEAGDSSTDPASGAGAEPKQADVIDADFEVVEDAEEEEKK